MSCFVPVTELLELMPLFFCISDAIEGALLLAPVLILEAVAVLTLKRPPFRFWWAELVCSLDRLFV